MEHPASQQARLEQGILQLMCQIMEVVMCTVAIAVRKCRLAHT